MQRVIRIMGICSLLACAVVLATPEALAEVSVRTTRGGEYVETVVTPGGPSWNPGIWGIRARASMRRGTAVLNPEGDRMGDLAPEIGEMSTAPHHPWAVWSRYNGQDYDLVWSAWNRSWSPVQSLRAGDTNFAGDDLDPSISFTKRGRPLLAWWNQNPETGRGEVYFSMFLSSQWMTPVRISSDDFGGRRPEVYLNRDGQIEIQYQSDDGAAELTQQVLLYNPGTITDDIDPQTMVLVTVGTIQFKRKQ